MKRKWGRYLPDDWEGPLTILARLTKQHVSEAGIKLGAQVVTSSDDGKNYIYEPHYGRLDRLQFPVSAHPSGSIWCFCETCRNYYKDVREVIDDKR